MQVREIMTANPVCATPDTSLREIAQMMVKHDCGCVPIVENQSNKKPIGTITDRDITIRAFATGQNPAELKASDAMTMGVATISPDANIEKCADVMEDKKIRRVVVVNEDGKVVGMVAQADLAEHASHPSLVGNVVNEISDAPASPNRGVFNRMRGNQSYSDDRSYSNNRSQPYNRSRSFRGGDYESQTYRSNRSHKKEESSAFGINSLLPLLAGIGISLAAKYYLGAKEQAPRRSFAARPVPNTIPESTHSTEKSVSVDTTIGSATSNDLSRSASASGSAGISSSTGASGTSNPFGSESSTGTSSPFDSSISTGSPGRSDFGNQTSGGSADLSTFGDGDFKSAGDSDLKPILEVGRNPGNV
jgi:CBS domain-containing protein